MTQSRKNAKWNNFECQFLAEMTNRGSTIAFMANKLQRTEGEILRKINSLKKIGKINSRPGTEIISQYRDEKGNLVTVYSAAWAEGSMEHGDLTFH